MIVDFGITWFLKEKIKVNKYIANSTGFILAATSNYFFNRVWTFESQNKDVAGEFASFFLISLIGLALNNLIIWILADKFKMNFYWSKLIAIGVVTLWNFGMNFMFTFAK
jgi:putative flippase GtrA